jgi:hypothetical protein
MGRLTYFSRKYSASPIMELLKGQKNNIGFEVYNCETYSIKEKNWFSLFMQHLTEDMRPILFDFPIKFMYQLNWLNSKP